MKPTPGEIAAQVAAVVGSPWPRTAEELLPWLTLLGTEVTSAKEAPGEEGVGSWYSATVSHWPAARAGWDTYRGELAVVYWFLWTGEDSAAVLQGAQALAALLTAAYGLPQETSEVTESGGGAWFWEFGAYGAELYAYSGAPLPSGVPTGPAGLQLHVSLRPVSDVLEAQAPAVPVPRTASGEC